MLVRLLAVILLCSFVLVACGDSSQGASLEPVTVESEPSSSTASQVRTPAPTPEPIASPTPEVTPTPDLSAKAQQPLFPDAEVLHVVQVVEPVNHEGETCTNEAWINRTTGDVVVRQTDAAGELRELTVKHGLTVKEYRAEPGSDYAHLTVNTMLMPDDPNLPDPLNHLNLFRDRFHKYPESLERQGVELDPDASFGDRPAVKLVMPLRENEQVIGTVAAYLDLETLYPLALIQYPPGMAEEEGHGHSYSYPTVEPLESDAVPTDTFSPEIPETQYTYIRERFSPEDAARFTEYPIWWLGPSFSGYELQFIERYQSTRPGGQMDIDTVSAFYLPAPDQHQDQLQIISQPPLSDIEWAHRDANHNVHSWEQTEIQGYPAWVQPGGATVELETPWGFITLSAPSGDLARAAAESLQRITAGSIEAR